MSPDYYLNNTTFIETFANEFFKNQGIPSFKNNEGPDNKTAVDLIVAGKKIDVQYSGNFRKWGDFRLDFVSADFHANAFLKRNIPEIFSVYEKDYNRRVTKPGKVFQENYLDYIIVFFYNDDLNLNHLDKTGSFLEHPSIYPDFFLLISKDEMIHFLNNNVDYCISRIKRNDKNKHKLTDRHGSAFIPISAQKLIEETHCLFGAFDLQKYSDAIKNYLSY